MAAEPARLLALAEAVADGRPVDWAEAESTGAETDLALVRELRLLAGVADVSRSADLTGTLSPVAPIPAQWGGLEIRDVVGAGSFGTIYRAWDARLQRDVALKLLNRTVDAAGSADEIVAEGRRLARVRHPHVVTVHGADCLDGRVGIWMDFIRGRTLEALIQEQGPLGAREAALIGIDLCGALSAVHRAGLVHRDVKTQNVMREDGGRIVLMDFGAGDERDADGAAVTTGTPLCMAPEVLLGGLASTRSDIYSLGVLLYRLVSGTYPVRGISAGALAENHRKGIRHHLRDARPDLPADFVAVVERALSTDPQARFATAGDMEAALLKVLGSSADAERLAVGGRSSRRWLAIVGLPLAAAVMAVLLATPALRRTIDRWTASEPTRLAVLPFSNPTGDPAQEHVARGVRDVLVSRLSTLSGMALITPRGDLQSAAEGGNGIGAAFLVDGSAYRDGNRLRVTARLTRAGTGEVVWSDSFDRPFGDIVALQSDIAATLAQQAGVPLSGEERQRLARRYSTSPEAQDAYLQGRYHLYRFNRASAAAARTHLERATAIDPEYALAHASLARVYLLLQEYRDLTPAEAAPMAIERATRAAELGPDLPEARVALAEVRFKLQRDAAGAEREYLAGLALSPASSLVRSPYARFLSAVGRVNEALDHALEGARLDPLSPEMMASVGITYVYLRDFDRAREWYAQAIALKADYAPGYFGRGRVLSFQGEGEAAVEDLKRAVSLSGEDPAYRAELARVSAAGGWRNTAEEIVGALLELSQARPGAVAPQDLAYVYLALGDRERALALLRQALEEHDTRLLFLNVDPRVDALRGDPRFEEIIRALGL